MKERTGTREGDTRVSSRPLFSCAHCVDIVVRRHFQTLALHGFMGMQISRLVHNREPLQTGTRCLLLYFQVQGLQHILGHRCHGRIMACVLEKGVCPHWRSASSVLGHHAQPPRVNTAHALQKCQLIECHCNSSCNSVWEILAITLRDTIFPVLLVSLATLFFYRG